MTVIEYKEINDLSKKIDSNTATLDDYKRYELLLLSGGISKDYIYNYLSKAGFNSWDEFVKARQNKETERNNAIIVGSLVGIGIGLFLLTLIDKKYHNKKTVLGRFCNIFLV